jgi:hypothetical protein
MSQVVAVPRQLSESDAPFWNEAVKQWFTILINECPGDLSRDSPVNAA